MPDAIVALKTRVIPCLSAAGSRYCEIFQICYMGDLMNIVWGIGEAIGSWAFPQVGAALQSYRLIRTAYKAAKFTSCFFTGDYFGAGINLAGTAATEDGCRIVRDWCLEECAEKLKWNLPIRAVCTGGCWSGYGLCKALGRG